MASDGKLFSKHFRTNNFSIKANVYFKLYTRMYVYGTTFRF